MKVFCLALVVFLAGCQLIQRQPSAEARSADEKAIRDTDTEWSKVAAAKDLEKTLSYYAEDATMFPANAPIAMGKPSIRVAWTGLMATPGFSLTWVPIKAEVARSADMGYTFGTYSLMMNDPTGKSVNDRGKYVVVWKKQPDNSWKAVADIFNSDLPASGQQTSSPPAQPLTPPPPA